MANDLSLGNSYKKLDCLISPLLAQIRIYLLGAIASLSERVYLSNYGSNQLEPSPQVV